MGLKTAAKKELEVPMPAKMQIMHETASSLKPRKREIVKMNTLSKVTKKDKMKIRKDHLQNRLKAIQMIKNEEKASVRRQFYEKNESQKTAFEGKTCEAKASERSDAQGHVHFPTSVSPSRVQ